MTLVYEKEQYKWQLQMNIRFLKDYSKKGIPIIKYNYIIIINNYIL